MQCQCTPYTVYVYMYTNTNFPNETYVGVPMCSTCGTAYQFFIHYWLNSLTFMYNTQPYGGEIGTPLVVYLIMLVTCVVRLHMHAYIHCSVCEYMKEVHRT